MSLSSWTRKILPHEAGKRKRYGSRCITILLNLVLWLSLINLVLGCVTVRRTNHKLVPPEAFMVFSSLLSIIFVVVHCYFAYRRKLGFIPNSATTLQYKTLEFTFSRLGGFTIFSWLITTVWAIIIAAKYPVCKSSSTSSEVWDGGVSCMVQKVSVCTALLTLVSSILLFLLVAFVKSPFDSHIFGRIELTRQYAPKDWSDLFESSTSLNKFSKSSKILPTSLAPLTLLTPLTPSTPLPALNVVVPRPGSNGPANYPNGQHSKVYEPPLGSSHSSLLANDIVRRLPSANSLPHPQPIYNASSSLRTIPPRLQSHHYTSYSASSAYQAPYSQPPHGLRANSPAYSSPKSSQFRPQSNHDLAHQTPLLSHSTMASTNFLVPRRRVPTSSWTAFHPSHTSSSPSTSANSNALTSARGTHTRNTSTNTSTTSSATFYGAPAPRGPHPPYTNPNRSQVSFASLHALPVAANPHLAHLRRQHARLHASRSRPFSRAPLAGAHSRSASGNSGSSSTSSSSAGRSGARCVGGGPGHAFQSHAVAVGPGAGVGLPMASSRWPRRSVGVHRQTSRGSSSLASEVLREEDEDECEDEGSCVTPATSVSAGGVARMNSGSSGSARGTDCGADWSGGSCHSGGSGGGGVVGTVGAGGSGAGGLRRKRTQRIRPETPSIIVEGYGGEEVEEEVEEVEELHNSRRVSQDGAIMKLKRRISKSKGQKQPASGFERKKSLLGRRESKYGIELDKKASFLVARKARPVVVHL